MPVIFFPVHVHHYNDCWSERNKADNDMQNMKRNHDKDMQKIKRDHEQNMRLMERQHEKNMHQAAERAIASFCFAGAAVAMFCLSA